MGSAAAARSASEAERDTASDRRRGGRANLLSRRDKTEIGALEVLYTDFTELRFPGGVRKAWLIPLLDHATRYVLGFAVGERASSGLELDAWSAAERTLTRYRDSSEGAIVH